MEHFEKVKEYLRQLEYDIVHEDVEEQLVVVDNPNHGIQNLLIDCEDLILVVEMLLFNIAEDNMNMYKRLLQLNREVVHGAFTIDEAGKKLIFRDTLQLENLDLNELEGTLNAISLMLSEYGNELLDFAKTEKLATA
jgi:hypothetical protein